MILITVELLPGGFTDHPRRRKLAEIAIANDGTGDSKTGNYTYAICGQRGLLKRGTGRIVGFSRKARNVVYLLGRVLRDAGYA